MIRRSTRNRRAPLAAVPLAAVPLGPGHGPGHRGAGSAAVVAPLEYAAVTVPRALLPLSDATFRSLGWSVSPLVRPPSVLDVPGAPTVSPTVTLRLSRDRDIRNRESLGDLHREAEAVLSTIARLERSVAVPALAAALAFGVSGAVSLVASVVLLHHGPLGWSVALGMLGLLLWLGGSLSHAAVRRRHGRTIRPLVVRETGVLADIASRADSLRH